MQNADSENPVTAVYAPMPRGDTELDRLTGCIWCPYTQPEMQQGTAPDRTSHPQGMSIYNGHSPEHAGQGPFPISTAQLSVSKLPFFKLTFREAAAAGHRQPEIHIQRSFSSLDLVTLKLFHLGHSKAIDKFERTLN